ncbi:MAG: ankyrin repeat domain-containing protein [Saprospiraceae bacterium]
MMRLHQYSFLSLFILLISFLISVGQTGSSTLEDRLIKAIVDKDVVLVRKLISKGANLDHLDGNGETPLFLACKTPMDDEQILVLLIEGGSKILYRSKVSFDIPFFFLCENQTPQVISKVYEILPKEDKAVLAKSFFSIGEYVLTNKIEMFDKLLPIFINEIIKNDKGFDLLEEVIGDWAKNQFSHDKYMKKYGISRLKPWTSREIVERLLDHGIDLNHPSPEKSMFYCAKKSPEVMQFILEHGFDYKKKVAYDHGRKYALLLEFYVGAITSFEQAYVLSSTSIHYDFDTIGVQKNLDVLKLYIDAGIDIPEGYTTAYDYLLETIILGGNHDFFYEFLRRGWYGKVKDFEEESLLKLIMSSIEIEGFIKEELERIYKSHFD